jgi:hypothetical protein
MHMAGGGDAQGREGGCTCILCIPPGYAHDAETYQDPDPTRTFVHCSADRHCFIFLVSTICVIIVKKF